MEHPGSLYTMWLTSQQGNKIHYDLVHITDQYNYLYIVDDCIIMITSSLPHNDIITDGGGH